MKHKHTLLLSALMLTALTSVFVGTGATAYAAEVCTHEYDEHIIEATCTEMGYTEYVCSLCGESYKDNYTEAKGHTYTETETQANAVTGLIESEYVNGADVPVNGGFYV